MDIHLTTGVVPTSASPDVARCPDMGAPLAEIVALAGRHGVRVAV